MNTGSAIYNEKQYNDHKDFFLPAVPAGVCAHLVSGWILESVAGAFSRDMHSGAGYSD